jgi:hypothetical protein
MTMHTAKQIPPTSKSSHCITRWLGRLLIVNLLASGSNSFGVEVPAEPFANPHLAHSAYSVTHGRANFTPIAGPTGPGHRLSDDEIAWQPVGPANGSMLMYSSPYPDGKKVIWLGGYDRISKLDADTFEVLTSYGIGGTQLITETEAKHRVATLDNLEDSQIMGYIKSIWMEPFLSLPSWYRLLSDKNELFMGYRAPDGSMSIRAYTETDHTDPSSPIYLAREWKLHSNSGTIFGMQMTHDGMIALVTQDGTLTVLSQDFSQHYSLTLEPQDKGKINTNDFFNSYVRNGLATDDTGGIYVVTRDNMNRIQWQGNGLSQKTVDGAWSAPYPNEQGIGSGTTPSLMGWGDKEDHLVIIADGTRGNNMLAFWRDEIPRNWRGIKGLDRRIAGNTPVNFGLESNKPAQIENSIIVKGYSAFLNNTNPVTKLPDQGNGGIQWLLESYYMHVPGHEAKGGTQIRWDSKSRKLSTAWNNQTNFVSSVCTISGATEILYCWGNRNREWTLEGINWETGENAFHYTLGKSQRYNVFGGPIIVAPNGAIDCACHGGMGIIRITPKPE